MDTEDSPLYDPAADDYAAGRADQLAGYCDIERAVRSEQYRKGQQDERIAIGDAELLELAERGKVPGLVAETFVESTTGHDEREQ